MAKESTSSSKQEKGTSAARTAQSAGIASVDRNAGATAGHGSTVASAGAIDLLKRDHRKVEGLFERFDASEDEGEKERLVEQICEALILHMRLEEDIFYPACRKAGVRHDTMDEAQVEHDGAKTFLNDLLGSRSSAPFWEAKVSVLEEMIEHHVAEEEKPGDGTFAQATACGIDDEALGQRLVGRKEELQGRAAGKRPIRAVSFNQEDEDMPRYGYAERDERGRFTSDDEREYGRGYGRHGNGGRGHGGWFGDSEGHSEAARSRWEGRSGGRYDDDERYGDSERYGRYGDDRYGRERDERGRFMSEDDGRRDDRERDERGRFMSEDEHRSASRYRDHDDDRYGNGGGRGHGGWYGDAEGHSRAARSRYDDDRYYSGRSRHGDDDHRSGGHGGWFGDPRGHAEASRRGWQHRR